MLRSEATSISFTDFSMCLTGTLKLFQVAFKSGQTDILLLHRLSFPRLNGKRDFDRLLRPPGEPGVLPVRGGGGARRPSDLSQRLIPDSSPGRLSYTVPSRTKLGAQWHCINGSATESDLRGGQRQQAEASSPRGGLSLRLRRRLRDFYRFSHHFYQVCSSGPGQPHVEMLHGEVRALRV